MKYEIRRHHLSLIPLSILLLLLALPAAARGPGHHAYNPMPNLMRMVVHQGGQLDLTAEQEAALAEWRAAHHDVIHALMGEIRAGEKAIMQAALAGAPQEEILAQAGALMDKRMAIVTIKARCRDNMRQILDESQWEQLIALYSEHYAAHQKRREGHGKRDCPHRRMGAAAE